MGRIVHYDLAVFPHPCRVSQDAALLECGCTKDDDVNFLPGSEIQNSGSRVAALPSQTEQSQQGCLE